MDNVLFNTLLFTGNANPALAQEIATHLGVELGKAKVGRFSDGEVDVEKTPDFRLAEFDAEVGRDLQIGRAHV